MTIAAVVLAAGAGSRFEGEEHKLLADLRGRPVIRWVLDAAVEAAFDQVYVVEGAVDLTAVLPTAVTAVPSPQWEQGQARTLQAGVAAAERDGHDAVVIGLGDQPLVPASAWRTVGAARGAIVVASFDGDRRPPVKLERSVWPLLPTEGDEGARTLLRTRPDLVSVVPCLGNPFDIDTREDLARWN